MPSKRANRYGTLAERWLADKRGLDRDGQHTSWCDARYQNGTPVEIKSCNPDTGYFQIYEQYHQKLREKNGWYGLVVYQPRGNGIRVIDSKMTRPDRLPLSAWTTTGGHRGTDKARVKIADVF